MIRRDVLLGNRDRPVEQWRGAGVVLLRHQQQRDAVQAGRHAEVIRTIGALADGQRAGVALARRGGSPRAFQRRAESVELRRGRGMPGPRGALGRGQPALVQCLRRGWIAELDQQIGKIAAQCDGLWILSAEHLGEDCVGLLLVAPRDRQLAGRTLQACEVPNDQLGYPRL